MYSDGRISNRRLKATYYSVTNTRKNNSPSFTYPRAERKHVDNKFIKFILMHNTFKYKIILEKCFRYLTDEVEDCCYNYIKIGNFCAGKDINLIFKHLLRWFWNRIITLYKYTYVLIIHVADISYYMYVIIFARNIKIRIIRILLIYRYFIRHIFSM